MLASTSLFARRLCNFSSRGEMVLMHATQDTHTTQIGANHTHKHRNGEKRVFDLISDNLNLNNGLEDCLEPPTKKQRLTAKEKNHSVVPRHARTTFDPLPSFHDVSIIIAPSEISKPLSLLQQDIVVDEDSDSLLQVSQLAQQQFNDDDFDDEQQASSGDDLPFVPTESTSKRIKIGSQHQAILPALQERPKTCTEERPDTLVYSPHVLKPEQVESFEKQCASIVGAQRLNREKVLNLLHQQNYHVEAALEVVRAQPYDFESDNDWTPKERAKAIYAIQFFKRNFVKVAKYVQTRSVGEVIDFYYKSKGHKRQALEDIRVHVDMAADEHLQQTQGLALRRQVVEVHSEEEDDDSDESDGDEQQVFPPLNSLQHHHFHQVVGNHKPVHSIIGMPTTTTTSSSPVLLLPNHVQPVANTITLPRGKLKDWSQTDMEQVVGKVFEDEFDMEQPDDTAVLLDSSSESDQYDNESVAQRVELSMPLALKHVHDNPPQLDALHDVMNKL